MPSLESLQLRDMVRVHISYFYALSIFLQPGYTIATGNVGSSKSQCKKNSEEVDWSPKKDAFINCVSK